MGRSLFCLALFVCTAGRVIDFELDAGAKAEDSSDHTSWRNGRALNDTLSKLAPGDVLVVPKKTFFVMGGISADGLHSVTIRIDGTLAFSNNIKEWPRDSGGRVKECLDFRNLVNVTFTSSGKGVLDGRGRAWWGFPGIGYLVRVENRPKIMRVDGARNCLFERLFFKNSPYWNLDLHDAHDVEIRYVDIDSRRLKDDGHSIIDLTAFNTDGIDITGENVWIHDCNIWNQDDCVAVKDNSKNMLIERINASGVGLTIGSIGGSTVRNITFRDCYMHKTYKGIYMKFRDSDSPGLISDILYENIVMDAPEQNPIWIGPAQQSDSRHFWAGHPCSIFWPDMPGTSCRSPASGSFANITLRNIIINSPKHSPGLVFGNDSNPMQNVVFDNVRVNHPGPKPWGSKYYYCAGVHGVATGNTWPVPPCFVDHTNNTIVV